MVATSATAGALVVEGAFVAGAFVAGVVAGALVVGLGWRVELLHPKLKKKADSTNRRTSDSVRPMRILKCSFSDRRGNTVKSSRANHPPGTAPR